MSNKIYNTDKVENKIGLKGEIRYDKIDVFIDLTNKDNTWGIVYYTEYKRNKPILKREIKKFSNFNEMIIFVKTNFNGYELNHPVDYHKRQVFIHNVDYINIDYYLHEGTPHLNYLELNYKEYINGDYHIRKLRLPKEYEDMCINILKVNKKVNSNIKYDSRLINTIDVNTKNNSKLSFEDSVKKRTIELNKKSKIQRKSNRIKNLKVIISIASLTTILTGIGYGLVKNSKYKPDVITQKNQALTIRDIGISLNKDKASKIIDNLMDNNYEEVTLDELQYTLDFIKEVENSNYDNNKSINLFNYDDYFNDKLIVNNSDNYNIQEITSVLKKIEKLYEQCFSLVDNELFIKRSGFNEYIDYVGSLTFMYDTVVDVRKSKQVPMDNQSITSKYATQKEIEIYNNYPLILKYIILKQLKTIISHSNYEIKNRPSYYFKGLDKNSLLEEVSNKMDIVVSQLKKKCSDNVKKSI